MVRIIEPYAEALLTLAEQNACVELALQETSRYLARDPENPAENEVAVGILSEFLTFLEEKGQQNYKEAILLRFTELALIEIGAIDVEVLSAAPLSRQQLEAIQRQLIMRAKKQVRISHRVDPSLMAGLRITAGGMVMDTSVRRQLSDIRERLYKGGVFYPWMR